MWVSFFFKQKTAYEVRISDCGSDVCSSDLEPVKIEFGLTDGEAGVLAGLSYGIAFALAAIPFGIAVDRFNRRNLLAMALSLWSGFTLICGLVNSYVALLFARSDVGAAEAGGRSEEHTSVLQSLMRI